jgi:hypothetical protein
VPDTGEDVGLGLAEAIEALRDDLMTARAAGAGQDVQLPVQSLTVELHVTATRTRGGKAGFRVPFVGAELGGEAGSKRESVQTVTVTFGEPVDRSGNPVKVAHGSDQKKK